MVLTKHQITKLTALRQKKHRAEEGLFIAEGEKLILELLKAGLVAKEIYKVEGVTPPLIDSTPALVFKISSSEMKKISGLSSPSPALGVFHVPQYNSDLVAMQQKLIVAIDDLQDPGNLGTIIRLCLWFGIEDLICSTGTVDCYNSKVIQSSMGAIAKVRIHYKNLPLFLNEAKNSGLEIYGTFLGGESIYQASLSTSGVLVMGNEGNGISPEVACIIDRNITIPSFMSGNFGAESLNVATATAIVLSEFKRRIVNG
ncbi:MAG TPA: RNA methyltransferase [Williamwhitmania sp.]|nr:RNA methyltransferase [Williamwhitmania sp.]